MQIVGVNLEFPVFKHWAAAESSLLVKGGDRTLSIAIFYQYHY